MELDSNRSAVEDVGENEVIANPSGKLDTTDETKIENNGTYHTESSEKENAVLDVKNSPLPAQVTVKSSSPSPSPLRSPSPVMSKGKGLKKWRRIKREMSGDGGSVSDNGKLMKRGLPNSVANSSKPLQFSASAEAKQNSEGSVSSTKALVRNFGGLVDRLASVGDSGLVIGPTLAEGMESENSEDRSSISSSAASAPKIRYEMPMITGFIRDKNRGKNPSGKLLGNSVQRGFQGKAKVETSKKQRGEVAKIEKENSHSSMESDSRSSNFVFMQGNNFTTSNGRQSGISINFDGENSDDALGSGQQLSGELQAGSNRQDGVDFEVTSQENLEAHSSSAMNQEKSENNGLTGDMDPLVDSITTLQSAQAELEKELERFREIGKDDPIDELNGSEQLQSDDLLQSSESLGISNLKQKVNLLESKFDDATALLEVKDAKIVELESILSHKLPDEEAAFAVELNKESYRYIQIELEDLYRRRIEAEVEHLAISRTNQALRFAVVDQITVLEKQKTEHVRLQSKLEDTEVKAARLKGETEKLENYRGDIVSAGETLKLKTRVCKYATCFFLQLILIFSILSFFLLQLSPQNSEVVPT